MAENGIQVKGIIVEDKERENFYLHYDVFNDGINGLNDKVMKVILEVDVFKDIKNVLVLNEKALIQENFVHCKVRAIVDVRAVVN